jgi:hypothetical protein
MEYEQSTRELKKCHQGLGCLCCKYRQKSEMQNNRDTSTDEVRTAYKRIPKSPAGCMDVCVVSKTKKANGRTFETEKQVGVKYGVQENTKKKSRWGMDVFVVSEDKKAKCRNIQTNKQVQMK